MIRNESSALQLDTESTMIQHAEPTNDHPDPLHRAGLVHPPRVQPDRRPLHAMGHQPVGIPGARGPRPHLRRDPHDAGQCPDHRRTALPRCTSRDHPVGPQRPCRRRLRPPGRSSGRARRGRGDRRQSTSRRSCVRICAGGSGRSVSSSTASAPTPPTTNSAPPARSTRCSRSTRPRECRGWAEHQAGGCRSPLLCRP